MTTPQDVPFVNLGPMKDEIAHEVEAGFRRVMETTAFIGGPDVGGVRAGLRRLLGVERTASGWPTAPTPSSSRCAPVGVGPGDEVVLPANTFVATAEAVVRAGATPVVLADCDEDTALIDVDRVRERLTADARRRWCRCTSTARWPPVEELTEVAPPGVPIVEDAAQSQGARRNGEPRSGSVGIAATSFYPGKNLGAYGDARRGAHDEPGRWRTGCAAAATTEASASTSTPCSGSNSRLDTLQAVVLHAKLARLRRVERAEARGRRPLRHAARRP